MKPNQQQSEAWNGAESAHYVDHADRYDRQLKPFTDSIVDRAHLTRQDAVLDVGCGCGATTLAAARGAREALGVDISEPLLDVADGRARSGSTGNAEFLLADAQTHSFPRGFDVVISQFGLMFFDDPVAALTNLRSALTPQGRLVAAFWQQLEANEWLMVLAREVEKLAGLPALGGIEAGPGMFALMDPDETAELFAEAGFGQIELEAISPAILLGGGGTLDESMDFLLGSGMARGLLGRVEPSSKNAVIAAVRAALEQHYEPGMGVTLGTGAWLLTANS